MKLIEELTAEELKARHIKVYQGGHHGNTLSPIDSVNARVDALEDASMPALSTFPTPEPVKPINESQLIESLLSQNYQLMAEIRRLERKLNEHLDIKSETEDVKHEIKSSGKL